MYKNARKLIATDVNVKEFMENEFDVSYATIYRYEIFYELILVYPRLIVTDLSFSQIILHYNRLLAYLEKDTELAIQLAYHVTLYAQNKPVDITPVKGIYLKTHTSLVLNTGPDCVYERNDWYDSLDDETEVYYDVNENYTDEVVVQDIDLQRLSMQ